MKLMSLDTLRSAGVAAVALSAGLAQAHEGHGAPNPLHAHVDQLLASTSAVFGLAAPYATELALGAVLFGAVLVWQRVRRARGSPR